MTSRLRKGHVGDAVLRREDDRLLRGLGAYLDDLPEPPGTLHVGIVRSTHAHATIVSLAVADARALPGVVAVLTGADMAPLAKPFRPDLPQPGIQVIEREPVCTERVRFVGDIVAVVLAEDRYVAEDAVDLVAVEYETLPIVVTVDEAMAPDAPRLHAGTQDNVLFRATSKTPGFDDAMASAALVLTETFTSGRVHAVSLEPRGCLATYDRGADTLVFHTSTQVPHMVRTVLAEQLGMPDTHIRVIAPDVGGGFGMKANVYPEELVVAALARHFGESVKWAQDRQDDFVTSAHARDFRFTLSIAVDADAHLLALELDALVNVGAYASYPFGASLEAAGGARNVPGPYRFRQLAFETRAVATNTCPTGAVRGVAAPISFMALEGMIDRVARAMNLDPAEVRRRNLLRAEDLPWVNATGIRYDTGDYLGCMERALARAGYDDFRRSQPPARLADGRYRGIGVAVITEQTGMGGARYRARGLHRVPGFDAARVRMDPSGRALVYVSHTTQGQGHLTAFAQIAAQELGIAFEDVTVVEGDTDLTPFGTGTFASRGVVTGGGAVLRAAVKVREKVRRIAGHLLEANPADVVVEDGYAHVVGVPALRVSVQEVARAAHSMNARGVPPGEAFGLEAVDTYDPPVPAVSYAAHVAQVSVDAGTGIVTIERYVVVHDCGRLVNPLIVEGQTHGAVVHGIGTVLWEEVRYGADGQPLATTLLDYTIPAMPDLPDIEVEHIEMPGLDTEGGFKGVGESGVMGAVPAVVNAVADALAASGVNVNRIPLRPEYLLGLIHRHATQPKENPT